MVKAVGGAMTFCLNGGNFDAPVYKPVRSIVDLKWDEEQTVFDSSDRRTRTDTDVSTNRWKIGVDFDMIWDQTDGQRTLEAAFWTGLPVEGAVLGGPPATGQPGFRSWWCVREFAEEFPLRNGQKVKVRLEPDGDTPTYYGAVNILRAGWFLDPSAVSATDAPRFLKSGTDAKVYDGVLTEMDCEDVKLGVTAEYWDSSNRDWPFDSCKSVRRKFNLEFNITFDPLFLLHAQLFNAFKGPTSPRLMFLQVADGPMAVAGTSGIQAWWAVTHFPFDGKLRDGVKIPVKLKPAPAGVPLAGGALTSRPRYFTVGAGGVVAFPFSSFE